MYVRTCTAARPIPQLLGAAATAVVLRDAWNMAGLHNGPALQLQALTPTKRTV
jgi:hypothetical protein